MLVAAKEEKKRRCLRVATHNFPTCSYSWWRIEHNDVYIILCTLLRDHDKHYDEVFGWIKASLSFAVIRATDMYISCRDLVCTGIDNGANMHCYACAYFNISCDCSVYVIFGLCHKLRSWCHCVYFFLIDLMWCNQDKAAVLYSTKSLQQKPTGSIARSRPPARYLTWRVSLHCVLWDKYIRLVNKFIEKLHKNYPQFFWWTVKSEMLILAICSLYNRLSKLRALHEIMLKFGTINWGGYFMYIARKLYKVIDLAVLSSISVSKQMFCLIPSYKYTQCNRVLQTGRKTADCFG